MSISEYIKINYQTQSREEIAKNLNISVSAVAYHIRKLGLARHANPDYCRVCNAKLEETNTYPAQIKHGDFICKNCANEKSKLYPERLKKYRERNSENVKESSRKYKRRLKETNPQLLFARNSYNSHKKRGHIVNLTVDEICEIAKKVTNCPFCGIELNYRNYTTLSDTPSLDRIDNEKELNRENVMIICHKCNITKSNRTLKEFVEYCRKISELQI